jgi:N utilization substance protein B
MTVRRTIRVKAFQALFQLKQNPRLNKEAAISHAIRYSLTEAADEMEDVEALKLELPGEETNDKVAKDALAYLTDLVHGVVEHRDFLNEQIEKRLQDWTIQRIDLTNLLILQIAAYELYFHEEINPSIVMNEAIEMTKSFNNDKASKFVNGVLQGILDTKEA